MKRIVFCLLLIFTVLCARSQVGVSYFFPDKGYFSIPVAPFSYSYPIEFRNARWIKLIPSGSFYSIGGMSVKGIPSEFSNSKPLMGPFYSISLSFMPALCLPLGFMDIDFQGGYFGAYNIAQRILRSNLDDMIANKEGWDACTSDFGFKNGIVHGPVFGITFNIWINDDQAICPGLIYYMGAGNLDLGGSYSGGKNGMPVETKEVSWPNTRLNYRGFEVQIGLQL